MIKTLIKKSLYFLTIPFGRVLKVMLCSGPGRRRIILHIPMTVRGTYTTFRHQDVSWLFWWAQWYLRRTWPILCPSALKMAAVRAGDFGADPRERAPQRLPHGPNVVFTEPCFLGFKHLLLYSNSSLQCHVSQQAVNISSHCFIHLMHYWKHIHHITRV